MPGARSFAALVVAALVVPGLTACGGGPQEADGPSKAAIACREKWRDLGEDVKDQVAQTEPSALPKRWNTIAATIDYNRTSATGEDCSDRIDALQQAITAVKAYGAELTVFDMEARLSQVKDDAEAYAAGPWPPAPTPTPSPGPHKKKHKKKKQPKPERPPKPALVAAALKSLTAQAPVATQQQGPGWEQASVVDLGNAPAVAKSIKDLGVLSEVSSGWQACQLALATIDKALAAETS